MRYGLRVDATDVETMNASTRDDGFGAEVKRRIMLGTYALSAGYYDAYYGQAQRVRTLIVRDFARAYEQFDVLLSPTSPTVAFEIGARTADPLAMYLSDVCTIPSNLSGDPAITVPWGALDGLPIGVQVLAPALQEALMFRVARAIEAVRAVTARRLPTGWEPVIGLEVHVELATNTKLFCGCRNEFGAPPNTNMCPVCLGLPGSLPVLNEKAVELALRLGEALRFTMPAQSIFHRKNYFYPDMPKNFQTSQYDEPICLAGEIDVDGVRVRITRAHLEEDTGKSLHVGGGGRIHDADHSLVDYNRAGVPLLEIVSEPDIFSAEQARAYVTELRATLLALGVSDVKMEEGSMRVDANVSVRRVGTSELGTRTEIKNMNSIRSVQRAIEYEIARQIERLEDGERIIQETRHWNEADGRTHSMRSKEEAYDYRYFPEPDLVPVVPTDELRARVRSTLPELPAAARARLVADWGISEHDARVRARRARPRGIRGVGRRRAEGGYAARRRQLGDGRGARARERDRRGDRRVGARARRARGARRSRRRRHDQPQPGEGRAHRRVARRHAAGGDRRGEGARAGERHRRARRVDRRGARRAPRRRRRLPRRRRRGAQEEARLPHG